MKKLIEVLPNKTALIERSLSLTVEKITDSIQNKGRCSIVLSGGSTPKPLYESLATQSLPWEKIHIFWGDERYVSHDHTDSNQRMARQAWLNQISIPAKNIHPMPTGSSDPTIDAQIYEAELKEFFQVVPGEFPALDVVLLGMGDDGHTASLFPQTKALDVRDRLITVGNKDGQPRLTFTIPLINQAHCVIFIVAGENKRPALAQIMSTEANGKTYPSRFIDPQGELWWLLDQAAGAEL
ncbi:6-phosphogluconolactonase [Cyanobacterium sp. uoEpiScrs1]|uniref:6-phosphogluconolactonase n=1 Tax=Cyanobacterium sp. uoEpiScrs1 TaxID=2976343 RepID=UPI002269C7DD|nr:6-phosphogluconolactonase [Cyanobacterium sp. uoEpiScrs1]